MDLNKILKEIDDVTEPASMEKLKSYVEDLQEETDDYMQLLVGKLNDMIITWYQPWYQKSHCTTRPLKETAENQTETYLTDTISKTESDRITKNWHKFVKVPDKPSCFARWKNKDKSRSPRQPEERVRHFVAAYLARGLERNLYQVYKHFITLYACPVKKAYTPEEEKAMEICFHHIPSRAVTFLSILLGRDPRGIYKRLEYLYNGKPEKKKLKWTLPLATKFLNSIMKHTGLSLEELKCKKIDKSVWVEVEKDMEQHYLYLRKFWYSKLHVQIFINFDVKINRLRKKIFQKLKTFPCQVWSDIRWKQVLKLFPDGFTHTFLYCVAYRVIDDHKKYSRTSLKDIINYALTKIKKMRNRNRRLKTLALNKDGHLEIVQYNKN